MKWLTISQIKRKSKTAKGALKVSYEHWNQLYTATAKELRAEFERTEGYLDSSDYCGLCKYYARLYGEFSKCPCCPFSEDSCCGGDLWGDADMTLSEWVEGNGNWRAWKRACKALRDKLKSLMDEGSKIKELLEKTNIRERADDIWAFQKEGNLSYDQQEAIKRYSRLLRDAAKIIDQALELLKQQPPVGEFTKEARESIYLCSLCDMRARTADERRLIKVGYSLCDRLDNSEASNAELLEALEKYGRHGVVGSDICEKSKHSDYNCTCGLEAAIAKAKKDRE